MHGSNHTEHCKINCIISHAQNTTALQPNVCFSGKHLHRHIQGRFGFPPAQTTSKVNFKLLSQYQYVFQIYRIFSNLIRTLFTVSES